MKHSIALLGVTGAAALLGGCAASSGPPLPEKFEQRSPVLGGHNGPPVDQGQTGTARFVNPLLDAFDSEAAISVATFLDGFYRTPGNDGYDESIERVIAALYGGGFGASSGFDLSVARKGVGPGWNPVSASISAVAGRRAVAEAAKRGVKARPGAARVVELMGFENPSDRHRVMLPVGAPSCDLQGPIAVGLTEVEPGRVLLTDRPLKAVQKEAVEGGAVAIVSDYILPYCVDPTGDKRDYDAVFCDEVDPAAEGIPSFQVSPRVGAALRNAANVGTQLKLEARVRVEARPLRTILATIEGAERPEEVVFILAHIDGAGANDNAAGAGGVAELALAMKRQIEAGELARPRRSVCFVFGTERGAGAAAMEENGGQPVAAIVADMIAADAAKTGAICLLERGWDPANYFLLPPDEHTPWDGGEQAVGDIVPHGLSIICREALIDVSYAEVARGKGSWTTGEHPWEGGGDHDVFLARGVASALIWHFTDFAFHTSLDRMDMIDPGELRRTAVAVGAAALAVADAQPMDLERHLDTLNLERRARLDAVVRAEAGPAAEQLWKDWFRGARFWLKALTAGEPLVPARPLDVPLASAPEPDAQS